MKKTFNQAIANLRALKIPSDADPKQIASAIAASLKTSLDIKPEVIENSINLDIEAITQAATEAAIKAVMQSPGIVALQERIKAAEEYHSSLETALAELNGLSVSAAGVLEKEKPNLKHTWGKSSPDEDQTFDD
jgi:stage V sporulation protein SpoVS